MSVESTSKDGDAAPDNSAGTGTDPRDAEVALAVTVLLEMYKENTNHGRHLETQRQLVTGFVLTVGAACLGALATLRLTPIGSFALGWVLIVFGLIGTAFSIVQYGKYVQSRARWRASRTLLSRLTPLAKLDEVVSASDPPKPGKRKKDGFWLIMGRVPLHLLWIAIPFLVFLMGTYVTQVRLSQPNLVCGPTASQC